MRLAMQLPERKSSASANDTDPREGMSAEVIDLASRNAFPAVTQRKGNSDMLGLVGGVAIVAALGAATLWGLNSAELDNGQAAAGAQQAAPQALTPPPPPAEIAPAQAQPGAPRADPAPAPVLSAMPAAQPGFAANPYSSPTLVFDGGSAQVAIPMAALTAATPQGSTIGSAPNDFASRVGGVGGGPARAARQFDPQTTITTGTLIPAVLETAINTDVPGFVRAVVSQDVRSYDGTRVLLPRSSRLIGQYQSGLQAGQKRAYVIWTRAIRPDGITVDLASPATDFSGQTGLPGEVNNHFFKRFGSSILLSVIGGLSTMVSGGAAGLLVASSGQSAASTALQQDGQIGPTVKVRPGEPIRVYTARDLDFAQAPTL